MAAFDNSFAINRACRALGLDASLSKKLIDTARPTIWLGHGDPVQDAELPRGTSKMGGEPDFPPELTWPMRPPVSDSARAAQRIRATAASPDAAACADFTIDLLASETPMAFLAQINLNEMAQQSGFDPALPDRGMLWAFNDPFADWYDTQSPSGGICLLWSDTEGLERRETPTLIREAWARGVSNYGSPMVEAWDADVRAEPLSPVSGWSVNPRLDPMAYLRFADERFEMPGARGDQLGGWEEPIQQVMHGAVELIANSADDGQWGHAGATLRAGERWRHVLTINAETYLWRLMPTWGDGAMYMFVDESDLVARRFDRAAGTSQMT